MYYDQLNTPFGLLLIVVDDIGLLRIDFQQGARRGRILPDWEHDPERLAPVLQELQEYFAGVRQEFTVQITFRGTAFQNRVWQELTRIPYGRTITYTELARRIGSPKAIRAVGAANARNPLSIIVPCHRIIGSDGSLTGYAGGLAVKEGLLRLEGARGAGPV